MSEIRVTNVLGENGNSSVNFTQGINMSGIVTATSFVPSQGQLSHRNKIINGGMNVSQRQTSSTNSSVFVVDRFKAEVTQMDQLVQTLEQSSDSPDGFGKSIKITTTTPETSIASNEQFRIQTKLEGQDFQDLEYGGSSAKTITISFYVKASVTGTFGFTVFRSESTNRVITAPYTISSADTWERKIITIPGDTAGAAITNDNAERFRLMWGLAAGSDYTTASASWGNYSSANLLGGHVTNTLVTTDNATWQLTGVQLEVGPVATPFEHRSFADELQRCKRYYEQFDSNGLAEAPFGVGYFESDTQLRAVVPLHEKRANITFSSSAASTFASMNTNNMPDGSAIGLYKTGKKAAIIVLTLGSSVSGGDGRAGILCAEGANEATLKFDAEL